MEALNEQQYPLVKLVLERALESELVRVQALQVQVLARVLRVQAPARVLRVQALRVQALVQVQLEPLVQTQPQVQLKLKRHLQRSCPKLQLHRHRCKVPDRGRESQ